MGTCFRGLAALLLASPAWAGAIPPQPAMVEEGEAGPPPRAAREENLFVGPFRFDALGWDPDGTPVPSIQVVRPPGPRFVAAAYGPGARLFAESDDQGTLRLWDQPAKRILWTATWPGDHLVALAWRPDGRVLA
jgi:hypothetical protein